MSDEGYRDLARDARDAVGALIRASDMGLGALKLNQMYGDLDEIVHRHNAKVNGNSTAATTPPAPQITTSWHVLEPAARERLVLEAIGDETRTQRQIVRRTSEILPDSITDRTVYDHMVYTALRRLVEAGEIDRRPGPVWKGRRIWVYYRRTELTGEIADIAEQFNQS